jgi:beta-glucanase (GH16 family)
MKKWLLKFAILLFCCFLGNLGKSQNNSDSTKVGYTRAKIGLFFKSTFDFRNSFTKIRYTISAKNSDSLILPKTCRNMQRTFVDSFNFFDETKWSKGQPWGNYHPDFHHQYYGPNQVFVKDGLLHLLNEYQPTTFNKNTKDSITIPYGTGLINSLNQKCFKYGYFAIRSKNPIGPATWPAFWLTGQKNWPPEIDIFEMYGKNNGKRIHRQTMTIHMGKTETHTKRMIVKSINLPKDTDQKFHIYACHWEPKKITFYTDGIKVKTIKLNKWMRQFYQEPMYLIVNNALDHEHLDALKNATMPQDFQVDWIQVFQR